MKVRIKMSREIGYVMKRSDGEEVVVRVGDPPSITKTYIDKKSRNGNFRVVRDDSGALVVEAGYGETLSPERIVFLSLDEPDIENAKALYNGLKDFLENEGAL